MHLQLPGARYRRRAASAAGGGGAAGGGTHHCSAGADRHAPPAAGHHHAALLLHPQLLRAARAAGWGCRGAGEAGTRQCGALDHSGSVHEPGKQPAQSPPACLSDILCPQACIVLSSLPAAAKQTLRATRLRCRSARTVACEVPTDRLRVGRMLGVLQSRMLANRSAVSRKMALRYIPTAAALQGRAGRLPQTRPPALPPAPLPAAASALRSGSQGCGSA